MNVAFQVALAQAEKEAKEKTLFRPCPRRGREAYAAEFGLRWIWAVAFLPMLAGGGATIVVSLVLRFLQASDAAIERGALAAGAVATLGCEVALCYRCVVAHYVYFRAPAKNLKAPEEKTKNGKARDVAGPVVRIGIGLSRMEATFPELPKVLGTRPECATEREMKGRRLFWLLSAIRIAASFSFAAPFVFWRLGWNGETIVFAMLAAIPFVWAGDDAIRYQGERHFGGGWDRASLRAELAKNLKGWEGEARGNIETLRRVELKESARAVEVLRATTDLTPEGARFLRIAEKEAKELEALRKMEEMLRKKENERTSSWTRRRNA